MSTLIACMLGDRTQEWCARLLSQCAPSLSCPGAPCPGERPSARAAAQAAACAGGLPASAPLGHQPPACPPAHSRCPAALWRALSRSALCTSQDMRFFTSERHRDGSQTAENWRRKGPCMMNTKLHDLASTRTRRWIPMMRILYVQMWTSNQQIPQFTAIFAWNI